MDLSIKDPEDPKNRFSVIQVPEGDIPNFSSLEAPWDAQTTSWGDCAHYCEPFKESFYSFHFDSTGNICR